MTYSAKCKDCQEPFSADTRQKVSELEKSHNDMSLHSGFRFTKKVHS